MTSYYNEHDRFSAAWLRELIKASLIADGEVDERDIKNVQPEDVRRFTQCHWFAGIGAWSYALRAAGWPDDTPVWTGSCPCQSFSASGKRRGFSDERHLWPAWFRLIRECRPGVIFGEQVASSLVIGKELRKVRGEQANFGFRKDRLQGDAPKPVQDLQEQIGEDVAFRKKIVSKISGAEATVWSEGEIKGVKPSIRSGCGLGSDSATNRPMRDYKDRIRHGDKERMEYAILGPCDSLIGLHEGEHSPCDLLVECGTGKLGGTTHPGDGLSDSLKEKGILQRIIQDVSQELEADDRQTWLGLVRSDLERIGYTIGACDTCAASVGAPHIRQRLYFVANSGSAQSGQLPSSRRETLAASRGTSETHGMADSECRSSERQRLDMGRAPENIEGEAQQWKRVRNDARASIDTGFWYDAEWLYCRDGKYRPVEPSIFPLVAGSPRGVGCMRDPGAPINPNATSEARVGRLRGYGNSIVAKQAQAFIEAYMSLKK